MTDPGKPYNRCLEKIIAEACRKKVPSPALYFKHATLQTSLMTLF
jgi:hypothetical protein